MVTSSDILCLACVKSNTVSLSLKHVGGYFFSMSELFTVTNLVEQRPLGALHGIFTTHVGGESLTMSFYSILS